MQPAVKAMSRLGMFKVTLISTIFSAFMSTFVAWVFGFFIDVPNYAVHIELAFIIPFFVSPGFSYFTALALRESKHARISAQKAARLDHLTEVFNRRAFFEAEARAQEKYRPEERRKILFIDIDHFKSINDRFGHEGGDEVLREFARLLRACLRKDDLVARFGGEEFVIALPGASTQDAEAIAERIRAQAQAASVVFRSSVIDYTVSIGISSGAFSDPLDRLLSAADSQLYLAKQSGRNCIRRQDEEAVTAHEPATTALQPAFRVA
jgi:diguanylate cyclase (GGDEF)-like protein